jgi:hypothetical protein
MIRCPSSLGCIPSSKSWSAFFSVKIQQAGRQWESALAIEKSGGTVSYDVAVHGPPGDWSVFRLTRVMVIATR